MTYLEWKEKVLTGFHTRLLESGFVPEAVEDFIEVQEEVMDMAYSYGVREADDHGED